MKNTFIIVVSLILHGCASSPAVHTSYNQQEITPIVFKKGDKGNSYKPEMYKDQASPILKNKNTKYYTYKSAIGKCKIMWIVGDTGMDLYLRPGRLDAKNCKRNFRRQLLIHRTIFKRIFSKWNKTRFKHVFINSLVRLQKNLTWNVAIARKSSKSSLYNDYRVNYPKHKSKKTLEEIFIQVTKKSGATRELEKLFKEFGFKLDLVGAKNVHSGKPRSLKFGKLLTRKGIKKNRRILYDASMLHFNLEHEISFGRWSYLK